jgi:hypothetical protein
VPDHGGPAPAAGVDHRRLTVVGPAPFSLLFLLFSVNEKSMTGGVPCQVFNNFRKYLEKE